MNFNFFCYMKRFFNDYESFSHIFGHSLKDEPLYRFEGGKGGKSILVMAGCHANEYITSLVACRFFEELLREGNDYKGRFTVIPLLNPDGVKICLSGNPKYRGNANSVDLNRNFDAGWEKVADVPLGNSYFKGIYPESEPEASALCNLCREQKFDAVCALHTQGEVIFSGFDGHLPPGEPLFSDRLSQITGYPVMFASGNESYGGFKDWFIDKYNLPGITIECGLGENPLPLSDLEGICQKVVPALLAMGVMTTGRAGGMHSPLRAYSQLSL